MAVPGLISETRTRDNLIAGSYPLVTQSVIIVSGTAALTRGALLGRVTASGKWNLSLSGASDGSEVPRAVLAEDTDASGGDKTTVAYIAGEFETAAMTFGASHTVANTRDQLRALNIYLKTSVVPA